MLLDPRQLREYRARYDALAAVQRLLERLDNLQSPEKEV
jgi:hypothetical protein